MASTSILAKGKWGRKVLNLFRREKVLQGLASLPQAISAVHLPWGVRKG